MSINILVVDDFTPMRRVNVERIRRTFTDALHVDVDEAASGELAIQKAQDRKYHVVLMDIMMPEMDGYETAKRIREIEHNRDSLILASTALNRDDERRMSAIAAGITGFVSKPVSQSEILDAVVHVL